MQAATRKADLKLLALFTNYKNIAIIAIFVLIAL